MVKASPGRTAKTKKSAPAKKQQPAARRTKKKSPSKRRQKLELALLKLSPRQLEYRRNRLAGMSIYAAARAAKYSESYSRAKAAVMVERLVKVSIIEELEMAGATNKWQAKQLLEIASGAMKSQNCTIEVTQSENGDMVIEDSAREEVPDYTSRLKALDQIAKLKRQISTSALEQGLVNGNFTRLTVVVEKDSQKTEEPEDNGRESDPAHKPSKLRVALAE